ncbi:MAG: GNAT family N-acetyltransferase [Ilumatobacteraceae bacterium]
MSIEIDPASPDWHELHGLLTAAYASMHGRIDPPSSLLTMTPDDLARKAGDEHLVIAAVGDELVGCLFCRPQAGWLYVGKMAVAPARQGSGIGRLLIDAARRLTERDALLGLELETRIELTENHATFDRLGFVKVAETSHPGYTTITSIHMRSPLEPSID